MWSQDCTKSLILHVSQDNITVISISFLFQTRTEYLSLFHQILSNTNYGDHNHKSSDFSQCLKRINQEEDAESDQDRHIVQEIFREFRRPLRWTRIVIKRPEIRRLRKEKNKCGHQLSSDGELCLEKLLHL